jgi:hypothetical protein
MDFKEILRKLTLYNFKKSFEHEFTIVIFIKIKSSALYLKYSLAAFPKPLIIRSTALFLLRHNTFAYSIQSLRRIT